MMKTATTSASTDRMLLLMENMVSNDMGVPSNRCDAPMMRPYVKY